MATTPTSLLFSPSTPPTSTRSPSAMEETPCPRPRSFSNPGTPRRNLTLTRRRSQNNSTRRRENGSALLYTSPPMETRSRACSTETIIHHSISPAPSLLDSPRPDDDSSVPGQPTNIVNKAEVTRRPSLPLLNTKTFTQYPSNRSPTVTTPIAPPEKDRLELVYNLLTSTFRFEWRSKLLPDTPLSPAKQFPFPGSHKGSSTPSQKSKPAVNKLQKRASTNPISTPQQPLLRKPKSTGNLLSPYNSSSPLKTSSSIRSQIQGQNNQQVQTSQSPQAPLLQMDHRTPPLLIDGRRTIIPIPKFQRTLKIYWRRGLDKRVLPTHNFPSQNVGGTTTCGSVRQPEKQGGRAVPRGETEVLVRRVRIPGRIWWERNFMGRWGECWVERC